MSGNQQLELKGTLPSEFKIVVVPYYGTATSQSQGDAINVNQDDNDIPVINVPLVSSGDGSALISVTVIYQVGCVLTSISGINIPDDNHVIQLHFIHTGCVDFLTVGEPLNGLPECCDIHAA